MDVRGPVSRTPSSTMHQSSQPYQTGMNTSSPYAFTSQSGAQLPPIQASGGQYMPQQRQSAQQSQQQYPPATSAPYGPDSRYSLGNQQQQHGGPGLLPQPGQQYQPQHAYPPSSGVSQSFPQRIAPAPPRDNNPYGPPDGRGGWPTGDPALGAPDPSKDQRTHVVGSQGRRGILPSAPGRPGVAPNGQTGPAKSQIPAKDADGKFPCPNCNKTYLHAKHLKRHLLRHTGDRPYMCVLCKDTFSRSDILKRHFQKCSVRRGNPTGASHLSHPAAHVKKNAAAQAKAAADAQAAANNSGAGTPNSGVNGQPIPYSMAPNNSGEIHRAGSAEHFHQSSTSGGWGGFSTAAKHNPMLYQSTASPDHFGVNTSHADEKRAGLTAQGHHPGENWHAMFPGESEGSYMNPMFPSSLAPSYDSMNAHGDVKNESHGQPANSYYLPNNMSADGKGAQARVRPA